MAATSLHGSSRRFSVLRYVQRSDHYDRRCAHHITNKLIFERNWENITFPLLNGNKIMVATHVRDIVKHNSTGIPSQMTSKLFEKKPARADSGPRHRGSILEILLDCISDAPQNVKLVEPIWTVEASHRALSLLRLILLIKSEPLKTRTRSNDCIIEYKLAQNLVDTYRLLNIDTQYGSCSCEETIQVVIRGLLAAFHGSIDVADVKIQTRSMSLPTRKRRALTLLLSELVINMLLDKSERIVDARLALSFSRVGCEHMNIRMETSCPLSRSFGAPGYEIVCGLAGVIGAEILYSAAPAGGTSVEILVPLDRKTEEIPDGATQTHSFGTQTYGFQNDSIED